MKFSVLLPTRNGGPYLEDAIASVLEQEGEFELVVSDNANTDETQQILARHLANPRLHVIRSSEVLTVTDNWMRALRASHGDYLLMIGDDDLLLPGFFERASMILHRHGDPDCLTFNAFSYAAPGSFGTNAPAFWAPRHFDVQQLRPERELPLDERIEIVRDMFSFRVRFPLNMQLTLFSRRAMAEVPGELFRAPFPDHFALNSLLLRATRLVVADERLLVVGVSPKSFGHFFYAGDQSTGLAYLGSGSAFQGRIEGSELVNSMYSWLLQLRAVYPELASLPISRWQYLVRQANHWYREVEFGHAPVATLLDRSRALRVYELPTVMLFTAAYRFARRVKYVATGRRWNYLTDTWPALKETSLRTIGEFGASLRQSSE